MSYFVELDTHDEGKLILNLEKIHFVSPRHDGCIVYIDGGKFFKVKNKFDLFRKFCAVPVSKEQIDAKIKQVTPANTKKEVPDVPALKEPAKPAKETKNV